MVFFIFENIIIKYALITKRKETNYMHKINFKKILTTLLLSLVLFTNTSNLIEKTDIAYTCSENDDAPYADSITKH